MRKGSLKKLLGKLSSRRRNSTPTDHFTGRQGEYCDHPFFNYSKGKLEAVLVTKVCDDRSTIKHLQVNKHQDYYVIVMKRLNGKMLIDRTTDKMHILSILNDLVAMTPQINYAIIHQDLEQFNEYPEVPAVVDDRVLTRSLSWSPR